MPYLQYFYNRLNKINLEDLLRKIVLDYRFETFYSFDLITYGYSDFNIKLKTSKGNYFVKIFSKNRSLSSAKDIVNRFLQLHNEQIPVPKLYKAGKEYLYSYIYNETTTYLCVMDFIDGKDFNKIKATKSDILEIIKILISLNKIKFKFTPTYDSWGTVNLIPEFEKRKSYLTKKDYELVFPAVEDYRKIDFSLFKKSIIHGDLHKDHIIKSKNGKYYLIDLETMDYNYTVIDLAIFIALFCINLKELNNDKILDFVIQEYNLINPLSLSENNSVKRLIRATHAIYLIRANYEIIVNKDESEETKKWYSLAKKGLKLNI